MKQTFVNLTAHTITEVTSGTQIKPSGIIARAKQSTKHTKSHNKMPIYATVFEGVQGLPDPVDGTIYIVSSLTMNAVDANRTDVVSPGNIQRDETSNIVGCVGFRTR